MQLFYAPDLSERPFQLSVEESKDCLKVLRKKSGDQIHVTDGRGSLALCVITGIDSKNCNLNVVNWLYKNKIITANITLAVAFPKNRNRVEWLIEKSIELGVQKIIPLKSFHSELKRFNVERAKKVALSAMKQSLRMYLPKIDDAISVDEFVKTIDSKYLHLLADAQSKEALNRMDLAFTKFCIIIGPEGDFSEQEKHLMISKGCQSFNLGKHRLRTETAAISALASLNALLQE